MQGKNPFPCPCCGRKVFLEPAGSEEICPVCFWQDDLFGLLEPRSALGPNKVALVDAQKHFASVGISDIRYVGSKSRLSASAKYELDSGWRPVDAGDIFAPEEFNIDRDVPYYWRADYWKKRGS